MLGIALTGLDFDSCRRLNSLICGEKLMIYGTHVETIIFQKKLTEGGKYIWQILRNKFALTGLDSASCSQSLTLRFVEMSGKLLLYGTYISRLKNLENGIDSKKDEGKGES